MQIKAIVFDASGTLLDDILTVWRANLDAYTALGFNGPGTLEDFKAAFRLPVTEFHMANGIPLELLREIDDRFREAYPRYAPDVEVFPGVEDFLDRLKAMGKTLAVVSNIPSLFLREHLGKLGIDGYFDVITGQDDCDEQKPSPKPILVTAEKLQLEAREAIYVGDMEEDIIAGKRASALTAGIVRERGYHPRWRLERQSPDFLISELSELLPACSG